MIDNTLRVGGLCTQVTVRTYPRSLPENALEPVMHMLVYMDISVCCTHHVVDGHVDGQLMQHITSNTPRNCSCE